MAKHTQTIRQQFADEENLNGKLHFLCSVSTISLAPDVGIGKYKSMLSITSYNMLMLQMHYFLAITNITLDK